MNGSSLNQTGTRRKHDVGRQLFDQASSAGSKALQCGHPYQKNSITSILPGERSAGTGCASRT